MPTEQTVLGAWTHRYQSAGTSPALTYFGRTMSTEEVDAYADGLAVTLQRQGVQPKDVVGIALQNCPQFVFAILALWKLGATPLLINPMYRTDELEHLLNDSQAVGIVGDMADRASVLAASAAAGAWTRFTSSDHLRANANATPPDEDMQSPRDLIEDIEGALGQHPGPVEVLPTDCAFLTYTSGTTGPAKGAVNTQASVLAAAESFRAWVGLDDTDVVLAMAPMFHITGAVINAVIALVSGSRLVLIDRFRPDVAVEAIAAHRVTFTVASITAYLSMSNSDLADHDAFQSVRAFYSGGAPVSPATVDALETKLGKYIRNVYGLTETTSAVVAVPLDSRSPVDPSSGVLSVGKPLPGVSVRVIDGNGHELPAGEQGELEVSGPSVIPHYWNNPDATAHALPHGALRTGDAAVKDADGWIYLVDRIKDQINTSGYKVWPREVEEVLLRLNDIEQAAVVGVADPYRGERVVAYIVATSGAHIDLESTLAFARNHLAAYKVPREVHVVTSLPMTTSGKVQRRLLTTPSEIPPPT